MARSVRSRAVFHVRRGDSVRRADAGEPKPKLHGEDVVIASNGEPMVRLVPVARKGHLGGWGKLSRFRAAIDAAFTPELDEEIARSLEGQR